MSVISDRVFDVAIVGLGPVGAILGNLLGQFGLDVIVLERDPEIHAAPRAVSLDGEIMRVLQSIGLADRLEPLMRPSPGAQFIDQDGRLILRRESTQAVGAQGWSGIYTFHQPVFEGVLRDGLARYPNVQVRLRHEVLAVVETPDAVVLTVQDHAQQAPRSVRARYVVGCDGARSLTRTAIGSPLEDLGLHEPWVVADFKLTGPADLPELSTQFCHPQDAVTYVHVVENRRRFEFRLRADEDLAAAAEPEVVWRRVAPWVTPRNAELVRTAPYVFHSLVAERWRAGRLLLAGDSAHQTPPFMGQGLCAGVRDASNLAWKLAAVARDGAPEALLDSYNAERPAHVRVFIELAVRIGEVLVGARPVEILQAAGAMPADDIRSLVYPTPSLGEGGLFEPSFAGGRIAPQPALADGRRLDDEIGQAFGLVARPDHWRGLRASPPAPLPYGELTLVQASGAVDAWLASQDATFAILRPDRYLFGLGQGDQDLETLLTRLSQGLGASDQSPDRRSAFGVGHR